MIYFLTWLLSWFHCSIDELIADLRLQPQHTFALPPHRLLCQQECGKPTKTAFHSCCVQFSWSFCSAALIFCYLMHFHSLVRMRVCFMYIRAYFCETSSKHVNSHLSHGKTI